MADLMSCHIYSRSGLQTTKGGIFVLMNAIEKVLILYAISDLTNKQNMGQIPLTVHILFMAGDIVHVSRLSRYIRD